MFSGAHLKERLEQEHSAFMPPAGNEVPHTVLNFRTLVLKKTSPLIQSKPHPQFQTNPNNSHCEHVQFLNSRCGKAREAADSWKPSGLSGKLLAPYSSGRCLHTSGQNQPLTQPIRNKFLFCKVFLKKAIPPPKLVQS